GRTDLGYAGDVEQPSSAGGLELAPQLIGAPQQGHIGGMLEIAEPDDAGGAMRGAAVVAGSEALEAQHALPPAREVVNRRAAHHAQATNRHVKCLHSASDVVLNGSFDLAGSP